MIRRSIKIQSAIGLVILLSLSVQTVFLNENVWALSPSVRGAISIVGNWNSHFAYELKSVTKCEIGDANIVFVNDSSTPIEITRIRVLHTHNVYLTTTSELMSFRPHSTTGEIAPNFRFAELKNGFDIRDAIKARVSPFKSAKVWSLLIARISVRRDVLENWAIEGLKISYVFKGRHMSKIFPQMIRLPVIKSCT